MQVVLEKAPTAAGQSLIALDFLLATPREFAVIAGTDPAEFRAVLEAIARAIPAPQGRGPGTRGPGGRPRPSSSPCWPTGPRREGRTTTYICERFACQAPVVGVEGLNSALEGETGA